MDLDRRISRLETLEDAGGASGGFWTLLEEFILTDNTETTIIFDNINQNYSTLAFIISARWYNGGVGRAPLRMRWNDIIINPDIFSNPGAYAWRTSENGVDNFEFSSDYIQLGNIGSRYIAGSQATWTDIFTSMVAYIPDYSRDDKIKPIIWHAGGYATSFGAAPAFWINGRGMGQFDIRGAEDFEARNDPLTKITLAGYGGVGTLFQTGSKFSMYGIGAAT